MTLWIREEHPMNPCALASRTDVLPRANGARLRVFVAAHHFAIRLRLPLAIHPARKGQTGGIRAPRSNFTTITKNNYE